MAIGAAGGGAAGACKWAGAWGHGHVRGCFAHVLDQPVLELCLDLPLPLPLVGTVLQLGQGQPESRAMLG